MILRRETIKPVSNWPVRQRTRWLQTGLTRSPKLQISWYPASSRTNPASDVEIVAWRNRAEFGVRGLGHRLHPASLKIQNAMVGMCLSQRHEG